MQKQKAVFRVRNSSATHELQAIIHWYGEITQAFDLSFYPFRHRGPGIPWKKTNGTQLTRWVFRKLRSGAPSHTPSAIPLIPLQQHSQGALAALPCPWWVSHSSCPLPSSVASQARIGSAHFHGPSATLSAGRSGGMTERAGRCKTAATPAKRVQAPRGPSRTCRQRSRACTASATSCGSSDEPAHEKSEKRSSALLKSRACDGAARPPRDRDILQGRQSGGWGNGGGGSQAISPRNSSSGGGGGGFGEGEEGGDRRPGSCDQPTAIPGFR